MQNDSDKTAGPAGATGAVVAMKHAQVADDGTAIAVPLNLTELMVADRALDRRIAQCRFQLSKPHLPDKKRAEWHEKHRSTHELREKLWRYRAKLDTLEDPS